MASEFPSDETGEFPSLEGLTTHLLEENGAEVKLEKGEKDTGSFTIDRFTAPFTLEESGETSTYCLLIKSRFQGGLNGAMYYRLVLYKKTDQSWEACVRPRKQVWTSRDISLITPEGVKLKAITHSEGKENYSGAGDFVAIRRVSSETDTTLNVMGVINRTRTEFDGAIRGETKQLGKQRDYEDSGFPLFSEEVAEMSEHYSTSVESAIRGGFAHEFGEIVEPWSELLPKIASSAQKDAQILATMEVLDSDDAQIRTLIDEKVGEFGLEAGLQEFASKSEEWPERPPMKHKPSKDAMEEAMKPFRNFEAWAEEQFPHCMHAIMQYAPNSFVHIFKNFDITEYKETIFGLIKEALESDIQDRLLESISMRGRYIAQGLAEMRRGSEAGLGKATEFLEEFEIPKEVAPYVPAST